GFGPVLAKIRRGETEFCISLVPLGGYVKLAGENPDEARGEPWEFQAHGPMQRFAVIIAGPILNAVLAFVIFSAIMMTGQPSLTTLVGEAVEGYPASAAGILQGDRIVEAGGEKVELWEDLLIAIRNNREPELRLAVEREGRTLRMDLVPETHESKGVFGRAQRVQRIGVKPAGETVRIRVSPLEAVLLGARKVYDLALMILGSLWMILTGAVSFKDSMAGPVGIYFMTQAAAQIGWVYLLDFTARLSVSLCVINLLPIPVLDGGHLFFILIEAVIRRPLPDRVKDILTNLGMGLILLLTAFVIYQDMNNFGIMENIQALWRAIAERIR
ncbi:MAG: RIP metalloprotease RseP, partial [Candidatus Omnitrophica bacterium]|nr:RIP metalloprotease RseP [Candidatus Omnitrophota bacterium]